MQKFNIGHFLHKILLLMIIVLLKWIVQMLFEGQNFKHLDWWTEDTDVPVVFQLDHWKQQYDS